ncbi:hypothetical protein [Aeromicrobium terrae]|jgi:hypothetical protein|uniref:Uncharacterized protein n=1 Tax=Aeromicrobium terrae TaxID=2498846 RepID=A0A5C8NFM2_9ACTN|nr:hypothetical protein [Aeromicrobium terrae]TXL57713.1 hypothetical protein FHP06_13110 [Aeromicrobium terrae]
MGGAVSRSGVVPLPQAEFAPAPGRHRRIASAADDGAAAIEVDVMVERRTAHVVIAVERQGGGDPATGEVELVTRDLEIVLPLVDGRATFLLTGRGAGGSPVVGRKAWVNYFGDARTEAATTSFRLSPSYG